MEIGVIFTTASSNSEQFVHCTVQVTVRRKLFTSNGQQKTISYVELFILGFFNEKLI